MSEVSRAIADRLKERGWEQKQFAHEWHEKVGRGSISTFETHGVSKLVNDEEEGFAFVLDAKEADECLRGLATVLNWKPEDLRAKCEAARGRPTLVLHPRLPEEQVAFFKKRAAMFPDSFRYVEANGAAKNGNAREIIRDLAKKYGPNAIVVVADDSDREFFAGADVRTSLVGAARPGFMLLALPDLTPMLPPRLRDDDGMVMIPSAKAEVFYREKIEQSEGSGSRGRREPGEQDKRWMERIQQADEEGSQVTFRIDWLLDFWGNPPDSAKLRDLALAMATFALRAGRSSSQEKEERPAYLWFHDGRVLALCAPDDPRRVAVAEYHSVHDVVSFDPLVAALRRIGEGLNPYAQGGQFDLSAELRAFADETGISLSFDTNGIRAAFAAQYQRSSNVEGVSVRRSTDADAKVHELLDDLLAREFILPVEGAPVVFELEAVRQAPLIHLASAPNSMMVVANVGAGRLLHLRVWLYPGEKPQPVRLSVSEFLGQKQEFLDGGNVRLTVMLGTGVNRGLEGTVVRTVARRREEDAAKNDD